MSEVVCSGCGASVPDAAGPVHAYMLAAPGCWAMYGTLLEWRSSLPGPSAATAGQLMVDAYAAQHPTNPDRRNRQSVAVHLMSLCAAIERGVPGTRLRHLIGDWAHRDYPLLLPRPAAYALTVRDVAGASPEAREAAVSAWAAATWAAWSAGHTQVRTWFDEAMVSPHVTARWRRSP